jgi:hypothetical protein
MNSHPQYDPAVWRPDVVHPPSLLRRTTSFKQPIHGRDWVWIGAVIWAVGLTALLCDHFRESRLVIVGTHTLFAIASTTAICRLFLPVSRFGSAPDIEPLFFIRYVTRCVYVVLYLLAAVRIGLYLYDLGQSGAPINTRDAVLPVQSMGDFQFYIVCCVVPLWVARALVFRKREKRSTG